jgi:RHS repeat-associated protein
MEYSAYGLITYRSGSTDTPFLFNGRYGVQADANGLLHMRARYYNPHICRFVNPDPIGFTGGINFYAYVDGNPISMIDPFGLWSWGKIVQGSVEVAGGVLVAFGVAASAAPTAGTALVAVPTVFLGVTHGMTTIGVGLQSERTTTSQQNFLNVYPSGPGQLVGMAGYAFGPSVGQKTETIGGLLWDVGSLGSSTFGVLNSFANGERMLFPMSELGLDAGDLFSSSGDTAQMLFENVGLMSDQPSSLNDTAYTGSWLVPGLLGASPTPPK